MTLFLNYWTLISFCFLISTAQFWWTAPSWPWVFPCVLILILSIRLKLLKWCVGLLIACLILIIRINCVCYQQEILFQDGPNITINAEVDSFFKQINHGFHGKVTITAINGKSILGPLRPSIWLVSPIFLVSNDKIRAKIKLKPITGYLNDVGFDAEKFALQQGVVGRGSVLADYSYWIINSGSVRFSWYNQVKNSIDSLMSKGVILALTFGIRDELSPEVKRQLKASGLSHLIAISGLHIGIVFGIGWFVGKLLFRMFFRWRSTPMVVAILCSVCYAWLAGFSIPTQRAVIACCFVSVLSMSSNRVPKSYQWLLIFSFLLFLDPFSTASMSLWLTMWAVAVILIFSTQKRTHVSYWKKAVILQSALVVGMMPAIAVFFHGVSLSSFIYNLVFVAWFSFFVVPVSLMALILDIGANITFLWSWADLSIQPALYAMSFAEETWFALSNEQVTWLCLLFSLWLLAPYLSNYGKILCLLCLLAVLIEWRVKPIWQVFVLDVGHGLAVVIQQDREAIIYDTGIAWQESSIAEQVITPFLHYHGVRQIKSLILSHSDNDHAGGMTELIDQWRPQQVISSQVLKDGKECLAGQKMTWGALDIEFIWPNNAVPRAYNPHSCVVRVTHSNNGQSILLTGDIDAVVEWILIRQPRLLGSDVIIVPHHGSRTSSTTQFIKMVGPDLAIASTAKAGKWQLPAPRVVERYKQLGVAWLDTGNYGQMSISFYDSSWQVEPLRKVKGRSWYRQMLRKGVE
ncbi:DNA internalization-related competence protein ComEC/Rec2 [Vibrio aquimaris]|uniref:ComEC family competence protein n=1 Tax=Vibrio aquimaris TaxID=2587862 RepID=A0A5P9CKV7_9VIBR|nr:ComEC family competence protein [Vibrio aquimaris]